MDSEPWLILFTGLLALAGLLQVRLTSHTARKQLRAYISVDEMPDPEGRGIHGFKRKQEFPIEVHAVAKNYGQTPAINVLINQNVDLLPIILPGDFEFPEIEYTGNGQLQPTQEVVLRIQSKTKFTGSDLEVIQTGFSRTSGKCLYVYGYVSYFDVFNKPHYSRFCFFLDYRNGAFAPPGWMLYKGYNDTDQSKFSNFISRWLD